MQRQPGQTSSRQGRLAVLAWKIEQLGRESRVHWKKTMRRQQVWARLWAISRQFPDLAEECGKCGDG